MDCSTAGCIRPSGHSPPCIDGMLNEIQDFEQALGDEIGFYIAQARVDSTQLKQLKRAYMIFKDSNFDWTQLKHAGFTASQLKDAGFFADQLADMGFDAVQLRGAGFSLSQLMHAEISAANLKDAGFSLNQLRIAGYSARDIIQTDRIVGLEITQAEVVGLSLAGEQLFVISLKPRPRSVKVLRQRIAQCLDVQSATIHFLEGARRLRDADTVPLGSGVAVRFPCSGNLVQFMEPDEVLNCAREMKEGGFSASQLSNVGFDVAQLREAGFNARDFNALVFDVGKLKLGGFSALELRDAGFTARELRFAGYIASELFVAGFSAEELEDSMQHTV